MAQCSFKDGFDIVDQVKIMFPDIYFSTFNPLKNCETLLRSLFAPQILDFLIFSLGDWLLLGGLLLLQKMLHRRLVAPLEDFFIGDLLFLQKIRRFLAPLEEFFIGDLLLLQKIVSQQTCLLDHLTSKFRRLVCSTKWFGRLVYSTN